MKILDPLSRHDKHDHIARVLDHLCSQENCDGEPYDQMTLAAEYIRKLEKEFKRIINIYMVADEYEADEKDVKTKEIFNRIMGE